MKCVWSWLSIGPQLAFGLFALTNVTPLTADEVFIAEGQVVVAEAQQAIHKQLRKALEPMLQVELSFANRMAKPTDAERRALIAASTTWLDQFVNEFVRKQDQNEQQMWMQGMQQVVIGGPRAGKDPRKSIEQGVAKLVAETLPAEKTAAYQAEAAKREEFNRDVIVANLVVHLDAKLSFSPEQREKIAAALLKNWDDKWPPQIESFAYAAQFFVPAPKEVVEPELTPAQKRVLERLSSTARQVSFFGGRAFGDGNEVIDDIDLAERPAASDGDAAVDAQPIVAHPVAENAEKTAN